MNKTCTRCGEQKPNTREFFGSTPSGGLRGYCRACMNKASARYEAANKEKRRERDAKRTTDGGGVRGSFDLQTKRTLWIKQSKICVCCFQPIPNYQDAAVDHVVPLRRGGRDNTDNLLLAHAKCNQEKHNKTLVEHWEWRVRVGLDRENLGYKHGLIH